jgi:hypothetical protein
MENPLNFEDIHTAKKYSKLYCNQCVGTSISLRYLMYLLKQNDDSTKSSNFRMYAQEVWARCNINKAKDKKNLR